MIYLASTMWRHIFPVEVCVMFNTHRPHRKAVAGSREKVGVRRRLADRPTDDGERGAALVEAAFILPLLLMLLLGTVTSALAYSQNTSLQTAAREGSRFGASLPVNGNINVWLGQVLDVAKAAGHVDLASSVPGQNICVAYVYPDGVGVNDRTARLIETGGVRGTVTTGPTQTCFNDGRPSNERRVQVVTGRDTTIQAVMFAVDLDLTTPSAARFERGSS